MGSSSETHPVRRRGVTLIEVVVSIGVLSILLAITLPAMSGARDSAQSTQCLATLRSLVQGSHLVAGTNGGWWPAAAPNADDGGVWIEHPGATTATSAAWFDQVRLWTAGLIGGVWEQGESADVFGCPGVIAAAEREHASKGYEMSLGAMSPQSIGDASYRYSAAMLSDPNLWDPSNDAVRAGDILRYARRVGMHEVDHTAQKVVFAERADFHGGLREIDDPRVERLNVAFADGHADRAEMRDAAEALRLSITGPAYWRPEGAEPFSAPAWGAKGIDF